jgi:hypothetical protein
MLHRCGKLACRPSWGQAGDAMDAGGVDGFGRVMAGRIVVSWRASRDVLALGGPGKSW